MSGNEVKFKGRDGLGFTAKISRLRSVTVRLGTMRRGKRAWAVTFRNRGHETRFALGDDAMLAFLDVVRHISRLETAGAVLTKVMTRVDYGWRFADDDGSEPQADAQTPPIGHPQ